MADSKKVRPERRCLGKGGADPPGTRYRRYGVPRSSQGYRKSHPQGPAATVYWKAARCGGLL